MVLTLFLIWKSFIIWTRRIKQLLVATIQENPNWPKVGIFAQRKKDRPNHIGLTIVNLLKKEERKRIVSNLDAINEHPFLTLNQYLKNTYQKVRNGNRFGRRS